MYDLRAVTNPLAVPGRVLRCGTCGMWWKALDAGTVAADAYGDAYGDADSAEEVAERYRLGEASRAMFRAALAPIERDADRDGDRRPRLLDVGTGLGAMLEEAAALGYRAEGIELCAPLVARARARGLAVRNLPAEALAEEGEAESFDVVTMMDLIEHVPDPLAVLRAARRLLRPGGELVVYTPNHRAAVVLLARALARLGIGVPVREIFGGNHVAFFDDRTLPAALDRAGFTVRLLRRAPYDPRRPGQPISSASLLAVTVAERLGQPFGRVFRMTAYARPGRR